MNPTHSAGTRALLPIILILFLMTIPAHSRQLVVKDVDRAFEQARELAFEGHYERSREISRAILKQAPDYHDVRLLIVRTYGWQEQFELAETELQLVLDAAPGYKEAVLTKIDLTYWTGRPERALEVANEASRQAPRDADLLIRRADLLIVLERYDEAAGVLNQLESIHSHTERVRELRGRLAGREVNNAFQLYYTYDHYSDLFDPWQLASLRYLRMTGFGPVLAHLNLARRFDESALQGVLEAYPRLNDHWYAHLNLAWSPSTVFPDWRVGGELYRTLGSGWEASLGARYLQFETGDAAIFTGSVTKFAGNWMFAARPFLGRMDSGSSHAGNVLARRYFGTTDTHLSLRLGYGFTPEERQLLGSEAGDVAFMSSRFGGLELYKAITSTVQWMGEVRITSQEMQAASGDVRILTFVTGLSWRF